MYWYSVGWGPIGSTRHYSHQRAYCASPGWLWQCRNWWNDDWQGKPKYSEKTCLSAALSTANPTCSAQMWTRAAAVGSQWLTTWATTRPMYICKCIGFSVYTWSFWCLLLRWNYLSLILLCNLYSSHSQGSSFGKGSFNLCTGKSAHKSDSRYEWQPSVLTKDYLYSIKWQDDWQIGKAIHRRKWS
jgi:hypothetical protein